jgi:hypothetical protein
VDLSQLLERLVFILSYIIGNNELGIKTLSLIDTGANRLTFIDTRFTATTGHYFDIISLSLYTSYKVRGFDGKQTTPIIYYIEIALIIDS